MENREGFYNPFPPLSRSVEGVECHGEQAGDARAVPFTARPVEEKPLSLSSHVSHAAIDSHFLNRASCFRVLLQLIPVRLYAVSKFMGLQNYADVLTDPDILASIGRSFFCIHGEPGAGLGAWGAFSPLDSHADQRRRLCAPAAGADPVGNLHDRGGYAVEMDFPG